MDSFELNKIIGAILGTLLFVMGIGFLAEAIYAPAHGSGPGYDLPAPADDGHGDTSGGPGGAGRYRHAARQGRSEGRRSGRQEVPACHDFT